MTVLIRKATVHDAKAIHKLNCNEMGYDYPVKKTEEKLKSLLDSTKDAVYVATVNDVVVGYVHANDYDLIYAPHMKNIMGMAVDSSYKRNGIGKALLCQVESWARQTGASGIRLVSGAERTDAHAFYRKCGFSGNKEQLNLKKML